MVFAGVLVVFVNAVGEFERCYEVRGRNHCFYAYNATTNWAEAREMCRAANSTLPIVTDNETDTALRQFILDHSNATNMSSPEWQLWLGLHARNVNETDKWFWIDGQPSGK